MGFNSGFKGLIRNLRKQRHGFTLGHSLSGATNTEVLLVYTGCVQKLDEDNRNFGHYNERSRKVLVYIYIHIHIYIYKGKVHPRTGHEGPKGE